MASSYPIRPITEDELADFLLMDQHAFNGTPPSERLHANFLSRIEFDRTLVAFDGETMAGGTGIYSFQMRVPGAVAAVAGGSLVAGVPSPRRPGLLSAPVRGPAAA